MLGAPLRVISSPSAAPPPVPTTVLPRAISFSACRSILCTDPVSMIHRPTGDPSALMPRRSSKCHFEPKLNLPRRCHGLEDASRARSWNGVPARVTAEENLITISTTGPNGSGVYRHVEVGVIEEVEEVSAKLHANALTETHLFRDVEIRILQGRTAHDIASRVSVFSRGRQGEDTGQIEPCSRVSSRQAARFDAMVQVRPIGWKIRPVLRVIETPKVGGERRARYERDNTTQAPASHPFVRETR